MNKHDDFIDSSDTLAVVSFSTIIIAASEVLVNYVPKAMVRIESAGF